jgi:hypothetical protein|tara:strand:- start:12297 stop:12563 length:267 start_codon:yes stop_codon:yes gene_type:complete
MDVVDVTSSPWASATFEGTQHRICLSIRGREADVDALAAAVEGDLSAADLEFGGGTLIEIVRTNTDKTVDGKGNAISLLEFTALSVLD